MNISLGLAYLDRDGTLCRDVFNPYPTAVGRFCKRPNEEEWILDGALADRFPAHAPAADVFSAFEAVATALRQPQYETRTPVHQ